MKVLITGISGRVGANLAVQLMKKGYEVRGLIFPGDPKTEKVRKLGVEIFEADMNEAEAVYRACDRCDAIVHLAAQMKRLAGFVLHVGGPLRKVVGSELLDQLFPFAVLMECSHATQR